MSRSKELTVDLKTMKIQVEVTNTPMIILIGGGKAKLMELPTYGETKVITHEGKIKRFRVEEGEEF